MYQFEIFGTPVAQKQTRFTCSCGKGRCYDPSRKDKEHIQWQVKPLSPEEPLTCAVELSIFFFMPIPKSASAPLREQMRNRVILPDKKPDEDNLAYLITNALKGLVYDDDKRVCAKHVYKFYADEPKTVVRVRPILQAQPLGIMDPSEDICP
jgi:Holliday junction resolvase RusA-like endonuclease